MNFDKYKSYRCPYLTGKGIDINVPGGFRPQSMPKTPMSQEAYSAQRQYQDEQKIIERHGGVKRCGVVRSNVTPRGKSQVPGFEGIPVSR
jgi:hypothetical protein